MFSMLTDQPTCGYGTQQLQPHNGSGSHGRELCPPEEAPEMVSSRYHIQNPKLPAVPR